MEEHPHRGIGKGERGDGRWERGKGKGEGVFGGETRKEDNI